jgi:hypothetical protein
MTKQKRTNAETEAIRADNRRRQAEFRKRRLNEGLTERKIFLPKDTPTPPQKLLIAWANKWEKTIGLALVILASMNIGHLISTPEFWLDFQRQKETGGIWIPLWPIYALALCIPVQLIWPAKKSNKKKQD